MSTSHGRLSLPDKEGTSKALGKPCADFTEALCANNWRATDVHYRSTMWISNALLSPMDVSDLSRDLRRTFYKVLES